MPTDGESSGGPPANDVVRRHVVVSGRVTGVFFRETCRRMAKDAGLGGWVRNTRDGGAEAVFEGPAGVVADMVKWCRTGPPLAVIIHLEVKEEEPVGETQFRVR